MKYYLAKTYCVILLRIVPSLNQTVTDGVARCLVGAKVVEIESRSRKRVFDMVNDGALNRFFVASDV